MKLKHDGTVNIAVGLSAQSKIWKNKKYQWSTLVNKLSEAVKTNETYKQYKSATKAEQGKIKDVGGYVGAYLRNGRRKPANVVTKQLITLDIDYAHAEFWDDFCMQFSNAAVLHSTHSHIPEKPRYRLILPISREVTSDEYVAIARRLAGNLGIELFDNTTFEPNRLMFWPSVSADIDYYFKKQDGPWLNADEILDSYSDWTDSSLWPTAESQLGDVQKLAKKQEDPNIKKGIVGIFCRAYSIDAAIEKFLKGVYVKADNGRYTYTKGSTAAGVVTYEDKFAFSHHGTDPISGKLCNAFDLIRIHKFGHLDEGSRAQGHKQKSYEAMQDLATKDSNVKAIIAEEKIRQAQYDFAEDYVDPEADSDTENSIEWAENLEVDSKGKYLSTSNNLNLILANDSRLKDLFKENKFDRKRYLFGSVPWRKINKPEPVRNVDYSGIRNYIESVYGITGLLKIDDALALEFERGAFHPIKDYLQNLVWDKQKRVETLLIDYLGADDTVYTREAIKITLCGAVARIFKPGIKFDLVLTLVGTQGTGKSTFAKKLGQHWFSDTFMTVHGKDAFEQLQGGWIIEMAELAGLRKAEVESIKHFISKQEDTYRPAYGRSIETYPRQCVFIGTTNNISFLSDPTGNRRFMPVDVSEHPSKSIFDIEQYEIDQIWAEAVYLYRQGQPLYLKGEAKQVASQEQKKHSKVDERLGLVEEFLNTKLPKDWSKKDIFERRMFLEDPLTGEGTELRDYVCVAEIWCECLGKEKEDMSRYKTRDLHDLMQNVEGWERSKSTRRFPIYGTQRYYSRKLY